MKKLQTVVIVLITIIILTSFVTGQVSNFTIEDWEDGDKNAPDGWDGWEEVGTGAGDLFIISTNEINGQISGKIQTANEEGEIWRMQNNHSISGVRTPSSVTFSLRIDDKPDDYAELMFVDRNTTGNPLMRVRFEDTNQIVVVNDTAGNFEDTGITWQVGEEFNFRLDNINYTENTYHVSINGEFIKEYKMTGDMEQLTEVQMGVDVFESSTFNNGIDDGEGNLIADDIQISGVQTFTVSGYVKDQKGNVIDNASISSNPDNGTTETNQNGLYTISLPEGNYDLTADKSGGVHTREITLNSDVQNFNFTLQNVSYTLKVNTFMLHGTTQTYRIENSLGNDVSNSFTVTSANSTVISVDNSQNKLTATSDTTINKEVEITASGPALLRENVTVASRTLDNIDIMPPVQFANAFLGVDDDGTLGPVGSEIQWIYLAIIIGSIIAWESRNEYLGIGTIDALITLFWIMGNVNIAVMFVTILFSGFAMYIQQQIPSRSDTNVGNI